MKTATAYTYSELSADAQKEALERSRYVTTEDFEWWVDEVQYWKDELKAQGYEIDQVHFSGFSSQGDGASFTAAVDVLKWLEATDAKDERYAAKDIAATRSLRFWLKKLGTAAAYVKITQQGRYCHRFTMGIALEWAEWPEPPKAGQQLLELEAAILEHARDQALKIYKGLESDYNGLNSDESVADFIEANSFLFWENGKPAHIG